MDEIQKLVVSPLVVAPLVSELKGIIAEAHNLPRGVQDKCPHNDVTGEYKDDTGNWCKDDDSYWIVASCNDCGKDFYADSVRHKDLYRALSLSGSIK